MISSFHIKSLIKTNIKSSFIKYFSSTSSSFGSKFNQIGLKNEQILSSLQNMNSTEPTPIQTQAVPRLINRENLVFASPTGSGKTLAYILPTLENLKIEENYIQNNKLLEDGAAPTPLTYKREMKRPRVLILVPTRELARQVVDNIKEMSHLCKVSSTSVLGGESYTIQKRNLDKLIDIVVASPGRLLQHRDQGNVFLSHVHTIIIDEVDTILTQGFSNEVKKILKSVLATKEYNLSASSSSRLFSSPQIVMATATLTKAVKKLFLQLQDGSLFDEEGTNNPPIGEKIKTNLTILEVDGLHKTLPNVSHNFIECKGRDKLQVLDQLIREFMEKDEKLYSKNSNPSLPTPYKKTLIFCNTVVSCQAVTHYLSSNNFANEGQLMASYHGDLNSNMRAENLKNLITGETPFLVCSDMAARGLDIPDIERVVMFDLPLNPIDYIHRSGRCGRAGRKGQVVSLLQKRDMVLGTAIQDAIKKDFPIDQLSSDKRDYASGRLSGIITSSSTLQSPTGRHISKKNMPAVPLYKSTKVKRMRKKEDKINKNKEQKEKEIKKVQVASKNIHNKRKY